jgi:hypothetical protein
MSRIRLSLERWSTAGPSRGEGTKVVGAVVVVVRPETNHEQKNISGNLLQVFWKLQ